MATNNQPNLITVDLRRMTNKQLIALADAFGPHQTMTEKHGQGVVYENSSKGQLIYGPERHEDWTHSHACCGKRYKEVMKQGSFVTTFEAQHHSDCLYYLVCKELEKPERQPPPPPPPMPTEHYRIARLDEDNWCIIDQLDGNKIVKEKYIGPLYTNGKRGPVKVAYAHKKRDDLQTMAWRMAGENRKEIPEQRFELVEIKGYPHVFKIVDRLRADKVVMKREVKSESQNYIWGIERQMISEVEQLNEENPGGIAFDREYFPQEDAA